MGDIDLAKKCNLGQKQARTILSQLRVDGLVCTREQKTKSNVLNKQLLYLIKHRHYINVRCPGGDASDFS